MVTKDWYTENKEAVLALYAKVAQAIDRLDKGVSETAKKIEERSLKLVVVGKANSGKSTFINAYLGAAVEEEILPTAALQCTSAIIEVRHGDKPELSVTRADGRTETILGRERIQAFLRDHAMLSDMYRNIPTAHIDREILIPYRGRPPKFVLNRILRSGELKEYNAVALPELEYNDLIQRYIAERGRSWGDIVDTLLLRWPLNQAMRDVQIVDTPGVGVGGDLPTVTDAFIGKADALLFVTSIKAGQSIENPEDFCRFLEKNCGEGKRGSVLVLCTGICDLKGEDRKKQMAQARLFYGNHIGDKRRVLFVDSLAQLGLNKCRALGTKEGIGKFLDKWEEGDVAFRCWYQSKGNVARFFAEMEDNANFASVQAALERFARRVAYRRLADFLHGLGQECTRRQSTESKRLVLFKGPLEEFGTNAKQRKQEADDLKEKISQLKVVQYEILNEVFSRYTTKSQDENPIEREASVLKKRYESKLDAFLTYQWHSGDQVQDQVTELKTYTRDIVSACNAFMENLSHDIIAEFNEKLRARLKDVKIGVSPDPFLPTFTEADFERVYREAETETKKEIEELGTFQRRERCRHEKLVRKFAWGIYAQLRTKVEVLKQSADRVVDVLRRNYGEKLKRAYDEAEQEFCHTIDEARRLSQNEAALREKIRGIEVKIESLAALAAEIEVLKEKVAGHADA